MTTDQKNPGQDVSELNENLARIETLSARLTSVLSARKGVRQSLQGPGQDFLLKTSTAYWNEMLTNPAKIIEQQVNFWGKSLQHAMEAQQALAEGLQEGEKKTPEAATPSKGPKDRRFSNPLWDTHPYYKYLKQQYELTAETMHENLDRVEGLSERERTKLAFFNQQMIDLMSPNNYLATNPDAMERAIETDGKSLVDGLENLVNDLEANEGELLVKLVDESAFEVGTNIATTEGSVVYRNRMLELIQYAPTTEKVHARPLLIFPPWINKFYILDLKEQNSLIKWIVDQGYTLFVVSWVNPDESYRDVGMGDYIEEGYMAAIAR